MKQAAVKLCLSLSLVVLLYSIASSPIKAQAGTLCIDHATTTHNYFENYENVEYSPSGYLILRFRTATGTKDVSIQADWLVKNDECGQGNVTNGSTDRDIVIPKGFSDFSIRFASTTHYDVWNDASSTPLTCPGLFDGRQGCSMDIPDYPDYYTFGWRALQQRPTGGPLSTIKTSFQPIVLPPTEAPILENTLPTPEGCTDYSYTQSPGGIFSNYERAEYVDGLLRVYYRMGSPYNDGRGWKARLRTHDASCQPSKDTFPNSNTASTTPYTRYFSLRFMSPTSWEIWNDELERKENCTICQGDLPSGTSYVSLMGSNTSGTNYFRGTPYSVVEPLSNVAFIPGIEASRLYTPGEQYSKLWEPNRRKDIEDLFLDENGRSLNPSIYAGKIIDEAPEGWLTASNIYESFMSDMDALVANKTIKKWQSLPYDWRLDYNDVLTAGSNIDGVRIEKMLDEILSLASSSPSGKTTIIAHSHGGLVAKALITELEGLGKAHLVDKLILVAVPQSGTPEAVAGLLHGDNSFGFPGNVVITNKLFRGLAEHAQAAFNLLPTPAYLARVTEPVAKFSASSTLPEIVRWRGMYGDSLDTPLELRDFLIGGDGRGKPEASDTYSPNVLLPKFLDQANANATTQDSWTPPPTLKVTQIVGWGIETVKNIEYTERTATNCPTGLTGSCPHPVLDRRPEVTTDGDKTVISYSADRMDTNTYYVNLLEHNKAIQLNKSREHADIMEVRDVSVLLTQLLTGVRAQNSLFIYPYKPTDKNESMRLSVHSPASIAVYDSEGRHTGLVSNPDPDSDLEIVEEQIPNSRYYQFGEGKYVSLPAEGGPYRVVIKGTGEGTFTLELESGIAGNYSGRPIFSNIPVNAATVATLNLDDNTLQLSLDEDGDGTFELVLNEGENVPTKKTEEELQNKEVVEVKPSPAPAPQANTQQQTSSTSGANGPIVSTFTPGGGQVLGVSVGPSVSITILGKEDKLRAEFVAILKLVIVLLQEEIIRLSKNM